MREVIKITRTIEQEISIEFPLYYKWGYLMKIESLKSYIRVCNDPHEMGIWFMNNCGIIGDTITKGTEITKEEFDNAFTEAHSWITRQALLDATESATEQDKWEHIAGEVYERNHELQEAINEMA